MDSKDTFFSRKLTLNFNGTLFDLSTPAIMGILNITPDSFYDGGKYTSEKEIIRQCEKMISEGASIIDIGAYSSRPGAEDIPAREEILRLGKALEPVRKYFPDTILSVDTFRSDVAAFAIKNFGVQMINDISAGEMDNHMFDIIAAHKVPFIMMHMKGTPQNMQQNTFYHNLINEITMFFAEKISKAKNYGICDVILDPGFGFGKNIAQNYLLLSHLDEFRIFELPILVGLSRKSMIYKALGTSPENALTGTITAQTIALLKGANILRVHDVKEAMETIKIVNTFKNNDI